LIKIAIIFESKGYTKPGTLEGIDQVSAKLIFIINWESIEGRKIRKIKLESDKE